MTHRRFNKLVRLSLNAGIILLFLLFPLFSGLGITFSRWLLFFLLVYLFSYLWYRVSRYREFRHRQILDVTSRDIKRIEDLATTSSLVDYYSILRRQRRKHFLHDGSRFLAHKFSWALKRNYLDVGCDKGDLVAFLEKRAVGFDISRTKVLIAHERCKKTGVDAALVVADAENLPFQRAFSQIVCIDVIEHLFDPLSSLLEIRRVLEVGGDLFLCTGVRSSLSHAFYSSFLINPIIIFEHIFSMFFRTLPPKSEKILYADVIEQAFGEDLQTDFRDSVIIHRAFQYCELIKLFTQANFRLVEVHDIYYVEEDLFHRVLQFLSPIPVHGELLFVLRAQ